MNDKARSDNEGSSRQRSSRYPRHSLEKVESLAKAVFDLGARNCDIDKVAQAVGYKNAENGAFAALRGSAGYFGVIRSSGGYISLSEDWIEALHTETQDALKNIRRSAMQLPSLYRLIFSDYGGKQLPNEAKLARDLHLNSKFGLLKEAAPLAAQIFIESANFSGVIDSRGFLLHPDTSKGDQPASSHQPTSQVTEFPDRSSPDYRENRLQNVSSQLSGTEGLDRIEIRLLDGSRAFLFIPVPLPYGEKERLKKYIDLLLEDQPPGVNLGSRSKHIEDDESDAY